MKDVPIVYPTVFDLEVWAEHQMSEVCRARRQASLSPSPGRARKALARVLIVIAHRLLSPELDTTPREPLRQPC